MKPLRLFLANYSCERTPTPGDADAKPGVGFQVCHGSTVGLGEDAESFQLTTLATFIASQPPGSGWTRHKVEVIQISAEKIERAAADLMKITPTSPMSAFLQRLAAAVRDVVTRGQAVHVDMDTARELWIVQGFPWNSATYARKLKNASPIDPHRIDPIAPVDCEVVEVTPTPSDFARGCMILAGASQEAGQMAELAALAQGCIDPRDAVGPSPWIGSNSGAWVAWELMVKELRRISPPVGLAEMLPHHSAMDRLIRGLALKCMRQCAALQDFLDKQPQRKDL